VKAPEPAAFSVRQCGYGAVQPPKFSIVVSFSLEEWALWAERNGVKPTGSLTGARKSLEDACDINAHP
jgi:hypothetical protein